MLAKVIARAATHARLATLSISGGEDKVGAPAADELRRFDTVIPTEAMLGEAPPLPDDASAEQAIAEGEQQAEAAALMLAEATAELTAKIARLRAELDARAAVDDEAWRVQQAVQRQEEADSMKMLALLREQDDAFAIQLSDAKADVEAAVLSRMRDEQAALEAEYMQAMQQLAAQHEEAAAAAREAAAAAQEAAVSQSIAATEARMQTAQEEAIAAERVVVGGKLDALTLEVSALAAVLSHDSNYKRTSHATHQLGATVLAIEESLTRRSMVPSCARR